MKPFYYVTYRHVAGGAEKKVVIQQPTEELAKVGLALKVFKESVLVVGSSKANKLAMSSVCNIEKIEGIGGE
ncbi:hypothetical protein QNH47_06225 [Virgibacillus halodenitrificans]|uniref:hypothetical protein n=1 Tax=Virgibacillus halodenitrificans TaxID=1482 RepID=UPI0024BFE4D9|nr:hypothetical protein [Virgibacillus halodenitrificans]WHX27449.1 hypothetical protein QNH47_06225 [Virgibacillus halodenitrificans]